MRAEFKVENPADVDMSMTITMPVSAWVKLRNGLPDSGIYPFYRLKQTINDLVFKAERHFEYAPEQENESPRKEK